MTAPTPQQIYAYLRERGADHNQAVGYLVNASHESGFNPGAVGPLGEIGLNQWNGSRRSALEAAAPDWRSNWQAQLDYGLSEPITRQYLAQQFASPTEASNWFLRNWERPAKKYLEQRLGTADRDVAAMQARLGAPGAPLRAPEQSAGLMALPGQPGLALDDIRKPARSSGYSIPSIPVQDLQAPDLSQYASAQGLMGLINAMPGHRRRG